MTLDALSGEIPGLPPQRDCAVALLSQDQFAGPGARGIVDEEAKALPFRIVMHLFQDYGAGDDLRGRRRSLRGNVASAAISTGNLIVI